MLSLLSATLVTLAPGPGVIAFVGSKNGQIDLFTVRSDGSDLRQLTDDPAPEASPRWSPDGRKIAFVATMPSGVGSTLSSYVYVVNFDGTNRIQATSDSMDRTSQLSWSPDGTKIAYTRTYGVGIGSNICIANSTGGASPRITNHPQNDNWPEWSPNNTILFSRGGAIQSVNPDGSGLRVLKSPIGQFFGPFAASPDGTKFAYSAPNKGGITIVRADGSQADSVGEASPDAPQWSGDGRRLTFISTTRSRVMVSTNSMVATPVPNTDESRSPTLSPDGEMVAFAKYDGTDPSNFGPVYALYVSPLGSPNPVKLPISVRPVMMNDGTRSFHIRWSPTSVPGSGQSDAKPTDPPTQPPTQPPVTPPVPPVPTGPGFPGTPVGPDRTGSPFGGAKTTGTTLAVTAPATITVGDAFFGPEAMKVTIKKAASLSKNPTKLTVTGLPAGVTAAVAGADKGAATVTFTGLSSLPVSQHKLQLRVTAGSTTTLAPVQIVRKRARILLVDDDREGNNAGLDKDPAAFLKGSLSKSDEFYRKLLNRGDGRRSLIYDTIGADMYGNGPSVEKMQPYDLVIWYIGAQYGGNPDHSAVFSGTDESNIRAYLQEGGGRTILMLGAGYISNVSRGTRTSPSNNAHWSETESTFLQSAMGVKGGRGLLQRFNDADLTINGETFMMGRGPIEAQLSPINPEASTPLATAELDPDGQGKRAVPVAVWNRVGDGNLVYVGFTLENVSVRQEKLFGMLVGIRVRGMASR